MWRREDSGLKQAHLDRLLEQLAEELSICPGAAVAVVGKTAAAARIVAFIGSVSPLCRLAGLYAPGGGCGAEESDGIYQPLSCLSEAAAEIVVISDDEEKESLLVAVAPYVRPDTRVLLGGYGHLEFRDPLYLEVVRNALVPSLANGYPNCLIHLYQCLRSSARLKLSGVVAEFGMFRGGTTMILSRFIEKLGASWKVIGFDTFAGFPPRRSVLDLYAHPDCVFSDPSSVNDYLRGRDVEIVPGDIVATAKRLATEDVVLAFIDTDNHASASAVLDVVTDRVVVGGAVVFDHWTGLDRHLYTVGERIAAARLAEDKRYLNLHGTGVFTRLA